MRRYKEFLKETFRYILAGFCTAFVNLATFFICSKGFSINYLISNGLAWLLTVITGFIVDKKYVFKNSAEGENDFLKFAASRVLSLLIDQFMIWVLVRFAGLDSSVAKIVDSAAVVMINYFLSRKIFKKSHKNGDGK